MAPLQTFYIGEESEVSSHLLQSHELFCVGDLNLPGLNTTFKDTFLEDHLFWLLAYPIMTIGFFSTQVQPRIAVLRTLRRTGLFCL